MALTSDFWKALARNTFVKGSCAAINIPAQMNTVATGGSSDAAKNGVRFLTTDYQNNGYNYLYTTNGYDFSVSQNVVSNAQNGVVTVTGTYTITNHGDSDFTIKGIYLYRSSTYLNPEDSSSSTGWLNIDYTSLSSPITIKAGGGVGQVVYTISVDYLSNVATTSAETSDGG